MNTVEALDNLVESSYQHGRASVHSQISNLLLKWQQEASYAQSIAQEDCVAGTLEGCMKDLLALLGETK